MADSFFGIKITADGSGATSTINQLNGAMSGLAGGIMSGVVPAFNALMVGEKVAGALKNAFNASIEEGKKLINESRKFNIPIQELQKLKATCDELGIASGSLVRSMKGLNKAMTDAIRNPNDTKGRMLKSLGLSADDLKSLEGNSDKAFNTVRQMYQNIAGEADREKFGREMFGGGFDQIKALLEATESVGELAKAKISEISDANAVALAALGNTFDDFGEQSKDAVSPITPIIGMIVEAFSALITMLITGFKLAWDGVLLFGVGVQHIFHTMMNLLDDALLGWNELKHAIHSTGDAEYEAEKKNIDARQKARDASDEKSFNQVTARMSHDASKGRAGLEKSNVNLTKQAISFGETSGLYEKGESKAGAEKELIEKRKDIKNMDEEIKYLRKHGKTSEADAMQKERENLAEELKQNEKFYEQVFNAKSKDIGLTKEQAAERDKANKLKTPKEFDKEFKEKFKHQEEEFALKEEALEKDAKLLAIQEQITKLEKQSAIAVLDKVNGKAMDKVIQTEIMKLKKDEVKLQKQIDDDKVKAMERESKEQIKLNETITKQEEGLQTYLNKRKLELMKTNGASQAEINQQAFKDNYEQLQKMQQETSDAFSKAKDGINTPNSEKLREDALKKRSAFISQFEATQGSFDTLVKTPLNTVSSDAAKKGMGGGIVSDPQKVLIDINGKQAKTLNSILTIMQQFAQGGTENSSEAVFGVQSASGR